MRKNSSQMRISQKYDKKGFIPRTWERMRTNPGAVFGLVVVIIMTLATLYGVFFISYTDIAAMDPVHSFEPPSAEHIFGTDDMGRDLFLRVIYGLRYSFSLALGAVAIAFVVGTFFGSLAGFYGGKLEMIIMRLLDVLSSIPTVLLGMVIVSVLGSGVGNLMLAIAITAMPQFVRMARASILTVRGEEYIEASKAMGMPNMRIIFTQAFPNAISPLIVALTSRIGSAILEIASLSYLGFGIAPPLPELGALVSAGRNFIKDAPYITMFPGLFILLTTFAFAMLGDGLRDALDPRLKK